MVTRSAEQWMQLLERQAAVIDSLEKYQNACIRRDVSDEVAFQSLVQARRLYRKTLSSVEPDVLFAYARKAAAARRM